jgi:intein/homing endonuclease
VQKSWIEKNNLGWDSEKGQDSAKEMFERMITMKFLPAGRSLWSFGSPAVTERRLFESLFNCVPKGSLIFTRGGLFKIEDTEIGQEVLTSDGYHKILNKFNRGIKKLVRIKTEDGEFRCTQDHKLAVLNNLETYEWKEAGNLQNGDRIVTPRISIDGIKTNLPEWKYPLHDTSVNITIPELDQEMAWLLGLFSGDGCTYPNYKNGGKGSQIVISLGINELDMAEMAKRQIERFGSNLNVKIIKPTNVNVYNVRCCSRQLSWYFDKNFKQSHAELKIPDCILKATKEIKLAFASGCMDSDGCVKDVPIVMCSICEKFVRELQVLLYSCGIESRVKFQSAGRIKKLYKLALLTTHSKKIFNLIPTLHKKCIIGKRSRKANGFPLSFIEDKKFRKKHGLVSKGQQINIDSFCKEYGDIDNCPLKVLSVSEDNEEETFDIEVEDVHEFYCNGILCHNCSFVTTENIDKEYSIPFTWMMNASMLGVGVATDVRGRGKLMINESDEKEELFVVPDSREGWVQSLEKLLNSYFYNEHRPTMRFDYSQIRPEGAILKAFGGVSSGYKPLEKMLEGIREVLERNKNSLITTRTIADICNMIAVCVVSGNIRRCIPSNSLILTNKGLVRIKDVEIGQEVLTSDGSYHEIINKFDQGIQRLVKIKTQDGYIKCTPNHRMAVFNSCEAYIWKTAEELKEGDRLITPRIAIDGFDTELPDWDSPPHRSSCKNIVIPKLDADIAWFLGAFLGDGCAMPDYKHEGNGAHITIVFGIDEYDMALKAKQQIQRFGDLNVRIHKRDNSNCYDVHCYSKQLSWYLDKNIKQSNTELKIPDCILKGTKEVRLGFIAGVMDSDGSVKQHIQIVSTIYENFARELQILLYSCGIETRLRICEKEHPSRDGKGWRKLHYLYAITKYSREKINTIPQLFKKFQFTTSQFANGFPVSFIKDWRVKQKYCRERMNIDTYCKVYGDIKMCPCEVKSVTEDIEEQTYDIEVEEKSEFYCDGYLCHNSAFLILGSPEDDEFIHLKDYNRNPERSAYGWSSNNSIIAKVGMDYSGIAKIIVDRGEPGAFWLENARNYSRMCELPDYKDKKVLGTNPCISGDTLIAVADGRRAISIKQLAEEGKDVPVYSLNKDTGDIEVKWGRNPRITGTDKKLYRVLFDDGNHIDVTENHKFFTMDRKEKETRELVKGDSLPRFRKYVDEYVFIHKNIYGDNKEAEHRVIGSFYHPELEFHDEYKGCCKTDGYVFHHVNEVKTDNRPENIEPMTFEEHNRIHNKERSVGEKNPMFGRQQSEYTKRLIGEKAKERFEDEDYKQNMSDKIKEKWEDQEFKEKMEEAFFRRETNKSLIREAECKEQGMITRRIDPHTFVIIKNCLGCGKEISVSYHRRDTQTICQSQDCLTKIYGEKRNHRQGETFERRSFENFVKQVSVYDQLKSMSENEIVMKKEWEQECSSQRVSHRFDANNDRREYILPGWRAFVDKADEFLDSHQYYKGMNTENTLELHRRVMFFKDLQEKLSRYPTLEEFQEKYSGEYSDNWEEFKQLCEEYNHRVISVSELPGTHAVYNITIDDNHTYAIVFDRTGNDGIFTCNCGEIS